MQVMGFVRYAVGFSGHLQIVDHVFNADDTAGDCFSVSSVASRIEDT